MAQNSFRREQPAFFIEDSTHICVGGYQSLHQNIGLPGRYGCHSHTNGGTIVFFIDYFPARGINAFAVANINYRVAISVKDR